MLTDLNVYVRRGRLPLTASQRPPNDAYFPLRGAGRVLVQERATKHTSSALVGGVAFTCLSLTDINRWHVVRQVIIAVILITVQAEKDIV